MTFEFDEAIRDLLADYAALQTEHQRLIAPPYDLASQQAHERRLYEHFRRATIVLEQLRQEIQAAVPAHARPA